MHDGARVRAGTGERGPVRRTRYAVADPRSRSRRAPAASRRGKAPRPRDHPATLWGRSLGRGSGAANWSVADELGRATTVTVFGGGSHCARPGTHLSPRVHRLRCRRARGCARGATPPREGRAVAVPLRGGGLTRAARQ